LNIQLYLFAEFPQPGQSKVSLCGLSSFSQAQMISPLRSISP